MLSEPLIAFSRLLSHVAAAALGGVGVFALVCSSLHPHPDAALMAIVMLTGATGLHFAVQGKK